VRKWYYARDGERFGPVPQSELQRLLEAGEVSPDEFVWGRGMEQWRPAAEVEGFRTAPADSPADEAPTPAADPPSAAETDPTVEGPPACSIQRGFSKAVTLAGAVGFVAGLCGLVDREEPLVVVVGLAIAVAVMGFGQLIGLTIDARRELWHIRHSLKQREEGPDGGEQDEEAEDDSPRAP
jgi:hypothetical protein